MSFWRAGFSRSRLSLDFFDFDDGEFLPMADGAMVALAALHLEGDDLVAAFVLLGISFH